ncbi:glycosyltransferase family 4 protein [Lihuaxuella thermophila]|uniref:Glycosyl transferases group 1 n=1 Tax=Lihuaxuella thermophila TaxID=1173111 RepID=A0A1H8E0A0_9BACL|nr:glycosyltransferase family 4 protein [Lihuaxuella thermophila]SEN12227.1 Glycosyl transferases group 1 [Lihuaxuella thermophila]
MKFTFPILTLCLGGAQRMLAELTNGLVARGHDVTILMPRAGVVEYDIKAKLIRTKHNHHIMESDYPKSDFIISNYYLVVPSAQEASQNGKGIHVRLSLCYEPTFLKDNHVSFPSYHATRHVLVISKWQQQIIYLNHGIKGHIVPIGISSEFKNLHLRHPNSLIRISAIVRGAKGTWSWHRDQPYLLSQLEMIKNRFPHVQINLFSPPAEFANYPTLQSLKYNSRYRILNPKNDQEMCRCYNETDIFVMSSTYDAGSLPGLEAMRCGAALVTTYAGGNMDYCRHEQNCLMSYRYQNRLAHDIIRLINDPSLRQRLAREGEKEAQKWTWERSVTAFETAIQQILESHKI